MTLLKSYQFEFHLNVQLRKKPREIVPKMKLTFQVCCLLMAAYWTAIFSSQYRENNDTILITMKKFNHDPSDKYPTFSFCIKGTDLHWAKEHEIFKAYGMSPLQYELMLKGETAIRYDRNNLRRSYNKSHTFVSDGINVDFNKFHLQPSDFIRSLSFFTEKALNAPISSGLPKML